MIAVKLYGALGNQMFGYALGRKLAIQNKTKLVLDVSHFEEFHDRKFDLECFKLSDKVAITRKPVAYYDSSDPPARKTIKKMLGFPQRITQYGFSYGLIGLAGDPDDKKLGAFEPEILKQRGNLLMVGFWQSYKYFEDCADTLRADFTFRSKLGEAAARIEKKINKTNAISLHVRRGDYVHNPVVTRDMGVLPMDYYGAAVDVIVKWVKNPTFVIFSDDIEWCKKHLRIRYPVIYCDPTSQGWEDMYLMSMCKHNIIANSTYSWWGAWLNQNPDKIVVSPKKWFNITPHDVDDRVPPDWIRL